MSFPSISYSDVAALVHDFINANCQNVGSHSLPDHYYKTYYDSHKNIFFAGKTTAKMGCTFTYTLKDSAPAYINALPTTSIPTDQHFGKFLKESCGITNLSTPVSQGNFINLLRDISKFCSAKIYFIGNFNTDLPTSSSTTITQLTHNTETVMVYDEAGTVNNPIVLSNTNDYKLMEVDDVNNIILSVLTESCNSLRCHNSYYTITLASN